MKLHDLLSVYETARAAGTTITPEELCKDHPDLIDDVRLHIRAIHGIAPPKPLSNTKDFATLTAEETATRYTVINAHARGGLGEVYLARDESLGRDVALKVMLGPGEEHRRKRFEREAAITSRLQHPGIVPVYGTGEDDQGRPCHVMRFITGPTLAEAIATFHDAKQTPDRSNPQFRQLIARIVQVSQTIAFAHSRGIVHRDLKPSNVILGDFGETLVVDWGLAKEMRDSNAEESIEAAITPSAFTGELRHDVTMEWSDTDPESAPQKNRTGSESQTEELDPGLTQAGVMVGTPAFLSPEQANGQRITPATDVFALGGLLYNLLTGSAPYSGFDTPELLRRCRTGEVPAANSRHSGVPASLAAVSHKAMATAPADRYPDAAAFAAELERWQADEPLTSVADPFAIRMRRWARRHRLLVTSSVAALVVAAIGSAIAAGVLSSKNVQLQEAITLAGKNETAANDASRLATIRENEALANFQTACDAVDKFTIKVNDDPRLSQLDLDTLKKDLLASAAVFYKQLVERRGDDVALLGQIANAHAKLALITIESGDRTGAEREYRAALARLQAIPGTPDRERYLKEGEIWLGLCQVLRMRGNFEEGLIAVRKARDARIAAMGTGPETLADRADLASLEQQLGSTYSGMKGDCPEAAEAFDRSEALARKVYAEAPHITQYWALVPTALKERGLMKIRADDFKSAEEAFTAAMAFTRALPKKNDRHVDALRGSTMEVLDQLSTIYAKQNRIAEAEAAGDQSHRIARELLVNHPTNMYMRSSLASALLARGNVKIRAGDFVKAEALLRESLELRLVINAASPELDYERHALMNTRTLLARAVGEQKKLSETRQLLEGAEAMLKDDRSDQQIRMPIIVGWARLAMAAKEPAEINYAFDHGLSVTVPLAQADAKQEAMLMLSQLSKAGCFKDAKRAARLDEPAFDSLRKMPEFQTLIPKK